MTHRIETLADGVQLHLGDCRRRGPIRTTPLKDVVACRVCDWTWKPYSGKSRENCPSCGKIKCVRDRRYESDLASIKRPVTRKRTATEWERTYRRRAKLLISGGSMACVRCRCDDERLLEINHKNGGGGIELKAQGNRFYRSIARMERGVDDLELLCRPCNAVHYLEMKYGVAGKFSVTWCGDEN
jgi:hypothetical protein